MVDDKPVNHLEVVLSLRQRQVLSLGLELERQAVKNRDRRFIIFEDEVISFGQFNEMANQYSNYFASLGFKKGDVVALLMSNRPEYLIAASGLSKLGVIVSLVNNGVRGEVLAHALNICDAQAIIVGHELVEAYQAIADKVNLKEPGMAFLESPEPGASVNGLTLINPLLAASSTANPGTTENVYSDDVIVYIYTSGTTGFPKATAVAQRRWLVLGHLFALYGGMNEESVEYLCLPLYHNSGFDISFSSCLVSGSTIVLKRKFSARNFWSDIRKYNVDLFIYVGELCRYIYNQPPQPDDADNPLKIVFGNGMRGEYMEPFRQRFNIQIIYEVYGATEGVGSFLNMEQIPGMCGNLALNGMRQGEVAKYDIENDEIVRDANGFALKCDVGETGLLLCEINELNKFAGYVNNPEATQAKILHDVFNKGDQYFNSGDLVQLHEREYFAFVDRLGDTFRWKSENVSTNQVSDAINRFGGIEDANVYGVQVPGMEGRCGMAALKLLDGVTMDWNDFAAFIIEVLPPYARPYFVRIRDSIDATNSFKQLKTSLQKQGYDLNQVTDPLYFLDSKSCKYVPLTAEIYQQIADKKIQL
ncbi:MAG: long-chain-acyl-CoA synthetase [Candidatus Saccharibacteria bacterium]